MNRQGVNTALKPLNNAQLTLAIHYDPKVCVWLITDSLAPISKNIMVTIHRKTKEVKAK